MRESYTPYTKLIETSNTTAVEIALTDSSGTSLECNYVQVAAVSGAVDGYFFVTPEVTSAKGYANMPTAATIPTVTTASGVLGAAANRETGVVVLSLAGPDTTSKVKLSQTATTQATTYAITYGNVRLANNLADSRLKRGN